MCSFKYVLLGLLVVFSVVNISLAALGDPCINNKCPNNEVNAYCHEGKCVCQVEDAFSDDRQRCIAGATNPGDACEENVQCTHLLTGMAYCNDEKQCECKTGSSFSNGRCQKNKLIGERCVNNQECAHIRNCECSSKIGPIDTDSTVCACNQLFVSSANRTVCLPNAAFILSPCEEDIQCQTLGDHAHCRDSKCICEEGYHFSIHEAPSTCIRSKGLGESCRRGECYLPKDGDKQNIECMNAICTCINNIETMEGKDSCSGGSSRRTLISMMWLVLIALKITT